MNWPRLCHNATAQHGRTQGGPGSMQKIHLFISSACAVTAVALGVIQTFDLTRSSPPVATPVTAVKPSPSRSSRRPRPMASRPMPAWPTPANSASAPPCLAMPRQPPISLPFSIRIRDHRHRQRSERRRLHRRVRRAGPPPSPASTTASRRWCAMFPSGGARRRGPPEGQVEGGGRAVELSALR